MIELEAKVWLDQKGIDPQEILEALQKHYIFVGEYIKSDWYFSEKGKQEEIFRLRRENDESIVTYKERSVVNGIESNQEIEFQVDNKDAFLQFSEKLGYEITFFKSKNTQKFKNGDFALELNFVEGLGYFLEIEILCDENVDLMQQQELLKNQFEVLGFSEEDFEPKKYLQLLREKDKSE